MYRHILVPTDGSPLSDEATSHAVALAVVTGARISFLTVTSPFHMFSFDAEQLEETPASYREHVQQRATHILVTADKIAEAAGVAHDLHHVENDEPYRAIIRVAEENGCDLIAMASHGRSGVSALVLGSETVKVLTHSTIPVLVLRPGVTGFEHSLAKNHAAERQPHHQPA